jgi:membrane protease YdiL (CAAX protease family)
MTDWLAREPRRLHLLLSIVTIPLVYQVWCTGIIGIYHLAGVLDTLIAGSPNANLQVTALLWIAMIPLVLGEEILFRLPLSLAVKLLKRWERARNYTLIALVIILSVAFGLAHGDGSFASRCLFVPMQGVMGVVFCVFYLKCGGFNGKIWKPLLLTWALHVMLNSQLFALEIIVRQYGY